MSTALEMPKEPERPLPTRCALCGATKVSLRRWVLDKGHLYCCWKCMNTTGFARFVNHVIYQLVEINRLRLILAARLDTWKRARRQWLPKGREPEGWGDIDRHGVPRANHRLIKSVNVDSLTRLDTASTPDEERGE